MAENTIATWISKGPVWQSRRQAKGRAAQSLGLGRTQQDGAEKALNALMKKVEEGDMVAVKMVVDRICPIRKPAPFAMPGPEHLAAKTEMIEMIMAAVADGDLTPGEALDVSKLATILSRSMERPGGAIDQLDVRKLAAAISQRKEPDG